MRRPARRPDPSHCCQVEAMAGYGIAEADIGRVLDIDTRALRELYGSELDTGHIVANATVAESLFRKATGDHRQSVTAAIFWLKTRARWREPSLDGTGGGQLSRGNRTITEAELRTAAAEFEHRIEMSANRWRAGGAGVPA